MNVTLDLTGWYPVGDTATQDAAKWQTIAGDEMSVRYLDELGSLPELANIEAVRRFAKRIVGVHGAGLISCDVGARRP